MAIDLKTETPDTTLPSTGFLFGADSQAVASPSVYTTQAVATTLLGSTTLNGATITADAPVLNLTQTWNNAAATFTGFRFNVPTDVSGANSLLMDLQRGGVSRFGVAKNGRIFSTSGATGGIELGISATGTNFVEANGGTLFTFENNNIVSSINRAGSRGFTTTSSGSFGFSSTATDAPAVGDTILTRRGLANLRLGAADAGTTSATVTITIATPGVVTWSSHGFSTGTPVFFTTTGALPTGITAGLTYYAVVVDANTFQLATTLANAIAATPTVITTSGSQSGTHTGNRNAITQRLSVQSVTGVADRPGADTIFTGSQGTGTGRGGDIIFQVAPAGGAGSAQNALVSGLVLTSTGQLQFPRSATTDYVFSGVSFGQRYNYATMSTGSALVNLSPDGQFSVQGTTPRIEFYDNLFLVRDAANTLAQRNGTNAQRFNVYNTWTSATNYEAFKIDWITTANTVLVGTEKGSGGGTARALAFQTDGTTRLTIETNGAISASSSISANGAITLAGPFRYTDRFVLRFPSDGVWTLTNWGENNWDRIQFGGTTASFPALKRVSANLQVIAADNAGSAGFIVGNQALATAATDGFIYVPTCAGTPTGTPTAQTGTAPIVVDTTNNKLYFYSGGAWRDAGP